MSVCQEHLRDVLRHWAAGVTIVTLASEGRIHGLTVSSFTSVSLEPPLISVVIDRGHGSWEMLERDGATFAVNILREEQRGLSDRFAWTRDEDRFADGRWHRGPTGAPVLDDALAWIDCRVWRRFPAGTHTIVVGAVEAVDVPHPESAPLVYWNRSYRRLGDPD